jgi:hypothetical protein
MCRRMVRTDGNGWLAQQIAQPTVITAYNAGMGGTDMHDQMASYSHIDLCFAWEVSKSACFSTYGLLWPTIEALDDIIEDIGFPIDNLLELEEMRQGFNAKNNGIMDGLVMVIDGLIVRTRVP